VSFDLDFILSLAGPLTRPGLVEIGAVHAPAGDRKRLFLWSTGRIGATVDRDSVRFDRQYGVMGSTRGVAIPLAALSALLTVCQHWAAHRHLWAAFYSSCSGYPAGYGGAWYFLKPGKRSKPLKLGSRVMGHTEGKELAGRDVRKRLVRPIRLEHGVTIVSRHRRVGEAQTPPTGLPVGLVYSLPGEFTVSAWRTEIKLVVQRRTVWFEDGDEDFLWELLRVTSLDPS
jgi:hypothetical protein